MTKQIYYFFSHDCGPCKQLKPHLKGVQLPIIEQDTDTVAGAALAQALGVAGLPTLILMDGERELARASGKGIADKLRAWERGG